MSIVLLFGLPALAHRVVMVEEAGEILEAHVLTSLGPNTEHLIMIGEHSPASTWHVY